MLANVTLFADVSDRLVSGIEVNHAQVINGHTTLLVMPQAHYELGRHWMIQAGVGARFTQDLAIPQIGFCLISEFWPRGRLFYLTYTTKEPIWIHGLCRNSRPG